MPTKIFLWTAPRCVSTAFERAIMEMPGSKIFHEPFSKSYHFGPERQSWRYTDSPVDESSSYQNIKKLLSKEYDGIDLIFSKDMAYAMDNNFSLLLSEELRDFQHTFLIRSPTSSVPSLYEASTNKQLTGWETFDPEEAGFKHMYELYRFVERHFNMKPLVIDADDLLDDPVGTMRAYCEGTGLPFRPEMLQWEPGPIPDWDVWAGWHENALKSSGIRPREKKTKPKVEKEFPKEVQDCIKMSQSYYNSLYGQRSLPVVDTITEK